MQLAWLSGPEGELFFLFWVIQLLQDLHTLPQWMVASFLRCDICFPRLQPEVILQCLAIGSRARHLTQKRMCLHSAVHVWFHFPTFYRQGRSGPRWEVPGYILSLVL